MSGTPRRPGSFPSTPQTERRRGQDGTPTRSSQFASPRTPLPEAPTLKPAQEPAEPLVPLHIIDAPSQRLWVTMFYGALLAWRSYDSYQLAEEEAEPFWLFLKWMGIDAAFLFGLPSLRIPWLEWSSGVMMLLFFLHAGLDWMLMFRVGIPVQAWFVGIAKLLYDKELAISERSVKPADILHNASLILGKQIIHILPEGSALLNPEKESFCLGGSTHQVFLPIQINQTQPISIELLWIDLETGRNETVPISSSQVKKLRREASKHQKNHDASSPLLLKHPVKKTGRYTLHKVVDESKLQVQTRPSEVMVVQCPQARIKHTGRNRCKGELSDVALEVEGTPPLRIKYRKVVNNEEREASFQSIQPDDFVSPLPRHLGSGPLVRRGEVDISWARPQKVAVPLNETLTRSGRWVYSIDEVQDALGNIVSYVERVDEGERPKAKSPQLLQDLIVHERPKIALKGCDSQNPLRVAKGQSTSLPVQYGSTGKAEIADAVHTIEYLFTAEEDLLPDGEHSDAAQLKKVTMKSTRQKPAIQKSGLYTLQSVSTEFCGGDVLEPASCLLYNPPEPEVALETENINDRCAGNPIGLRVGLNFIGTPPFTVKYKEQRRGHSHHFVGRQTFHASRGQLELIPHEAGHYTYSFEEVSDSVYQAVPLKGLVLQQDVKPSASAYFVDADRPREACIEESAQFKVRLQGEGPWTLEYELVHAGKRTKGKAANITDEDFTIVTAPLKHGGEAIVTLTSVQDGMGCKELLDKQAKIQVRHERPKAYFGQIEGKRSVRTLEGKKIQLPLRLTGKGPWTLNYQNLETDEKPHTKTVYKANDFLDISREGTYELSDVMDAVCPGSIDPKSNRFQVSWVPRPTISVPESSTIGFAGGKYIKQDVCEGDEDIFEVNLSGTPPYTVKYQEIHKPDQGAKALRNKDLNAALNVASIRMETVQAGLYEYKFTEIGDYNYDHDPKKHDPVVVQQRVNPRPNARFNNPGKTYSYCTHEGEGEEVIPVTFVGVPPFYMEVEIRRNGINKPEALTIPNIATHSFDLRIPYRHLQKGHSNVSIRKVRDGRGCQRKLDPVNSPRVQISVHDAPTIMPNEDRTDYCVGERLSFNLVGAAPFAVYYNFNGVERKASSSGTTFRRIAEKPGIFTITGVQDSASECRANVALTKVIHEMPSVRISKGRESVVDIHEGGEAEILFEFGGTPPFEFTFTRSTNARKGKKSVLLESRSLVSEEHTMRISASEEGTYEVTSIKDRWCKFSKPGTEGPSRNQKLLKY